MKKEYRLHIETKGSRGSEVYCVRDYIVFFFVDVHPDGLKAIWAKEIWVQTPK